MVCGNGTIELVISTSDVCLSVPGSYRTADEPSMGPRGHSALANRLSLDKDGASVLSAMRSRTLGRRKPLSGDQYTVLGYSRSMYVMT